MRKLTRDDVTITVKCEPEDMSIEGNCMASGDEDFDKECADEIRSKLEAGNDWAWCCVALTVSWQGFEASDYLGGCSYDSEEDFRKPGGYFDDMVDAALEALNEKVQAAHNAMELF